MTTPPPEFTRADRIRLLKRRAQQAGFVLGRVGRGSRAMTRATIRVAGYGSLGTANSLRNEIRNQQGPLKPVQAMKAFAILSGSSSINKSNWLPDFQRRFQEITGTAVQGDFSHWLVGYVRKTKENPDGLNSGQIDLYARLIESGMIARAKKEVAIMPMFAQSPWKKFVAGFSANKSSSEGSEWLLNVTAVLTTESRPGVVKFAKNVARGVRMVVPPNPPPSGKIRRAKLILPNSNGWNPANQPLTAHYMDQLEKAMHKLSHAERIAYLRGACWLLDIRVKAPKVPGFRPHTYIAIGVNGAKKLLKKTVKTQSDLEALQEAVFESARVLKLKPIHRGMHKQAINRDVDRLVKKKKAAKAYKKLQKTGRKNHKKMQKAQKRAAGQQSLWFKAAVRTAHGVITVTQAVGRAARIMSPARLMRVIRHGRIGAVAKILKQRATRRVLGNGQVRAANRALQGNLKGRAAYKAAVAANKAAVAGVAPNRNTPVGQGVPPSKKLKTQWLHTAANVGMEPAPPPAAFHVANGPLGETRKLRRERSKIPEVTPQISYDIDPDGRPTLQNKKGEPVIPAVAIRPGITIEFPDTKQINHSPEAPRGERPDSPLLTPEQAPVRTIQGEVLAYGPPASPLALTNSPVEPPPPGLSVRVFISEPASAQKGRAGAIPSVGIKQVTITPAPAPSSTTPEPTPQAAPFSAANPDLAEALLKARQGSTGNDGISNPAATPPVPSPVGTPATPSPAHATTPSQPVSAASAASTPTTNRPASPTPSMPSPAPSPTATPQPIPLRNQTRAAGETPGATRRPPSAAEVASQPDSQEKSARPDGHMTTPPLPVAPPRAPDSDKTAKEATSADKRQSAGKEKGPNKGDGRGMGK